MKSEGPFSLIILEKLHVLVIHIGMLVHDSEFEDEQF